MSGRVCFMNVIRITYIYRICFVKYKYCALWIFSTFIPTHTQYFFSFLFCIVLLIRCVWLLFEIWHVYCIKMVKIV